MVLPHPATAAIPESHPAKPGPVQVLEEMEAEGHKKNELTFTLLVRTHLARRNTAEAVEALAAMRDAGLAPGMKLYDLVRPTSAALSSQIIRK